VEDWKTGDTHINSRYPIPFYNGNDFVLSFQAFIYFYRDLLVSMMFNNGNGLDVQNQSQITLTAIRNPENVV
jgi:hypothetical protein